jgi:hypothetical protein
MSLKHLSESVKPDGKLFNTVAEIAIYALKDRKAKIPVKQILPLRIVVGIPPFLLTDVSNLYAYFFKQKGQDSCKTNTPTKNCCGNFSFFTY